MNIRASSGFALLLVLWTLVVLSTIALTLAASAGGELRAGQETWNELQAERLAQSGHEFAAYLEYRGIGTSIEDFAGLPVQQAIAGLQYRVVLDIGSVDLVLEGANARLDIGVASEEDMARFFTSWTGDSTRSHEIAASIVDWRDSDDDPRPFGAESAWYSGRGYRPRNAGIGTADLFLIKGMKPDDFLPIMQNGGEAPVVRPSLARAVSAVAAGNIVNPNYALPVVLRSLPGVDEDILDRILKARQQSVFIDVKDFANRLGIAETSTLLSRIAFNRGIAPSILAVGRLSYSTTIRAERRIRSPLIGRSPVPINLVSLIERSTAE